MAKQRVKQLARQRMNLKNDRFIKALLRQPVDKTPVWMMRQAGRYLPEYRKVRAQAGNFMNLMKHPELACEVTLQPLARYPLDAAILFSDILTIPDAMGLGLHFVTGEGPRFQSPVQTIDAIKKLTVPDPEQDLSYVLSAIRLIKHELDGKVPLIGFSGSPWTLACYMVEGQSSKDFRTVKALMYQEPEAMHQLLSTLSQSVSDYLNAQIKAGVQAVMIFDTWGGLLSTPDYQEFSLAYMQRIIDQLHREAQSEPIPVILFTKHGGLWLEQMVKSGCDAIGLDWTIDIASAKARVGQHVALQGNMDPACLLAKPERIRQEVAHILQAFGYGNGHIFNLGHGITPDVEPENVSVFIHAVHELSGLYHDNKEFV